MGIKPEDIIKEIENAPPFQRDDVAKNYENISVNWDVYFESIFDKGNKEIRLMLGANSFGYPWIYCSVNLEEYPEIKVIKTGKRIWITGKIARVRGHEIYLTGCKLKFKKDKGYNKNNSIIQIKNPQFHFGKGDNVGGNKIEEDKSRKEASLKEYKGQKKQWWLNLPIIIMIASLSIAVISIPWWPQVIQYFSKNKSETSFFDPTSTRISKDFNTQSLRTLEPLETGKKIGELPNGIYFFAGSHAIMYEIEAPEDNFIQAENKGLINHSFEIQKIDDRYFLVGFVSNESYSNIGSVKLGKTLYTVLFPNQCVEATHPIAVPFDAIHRIGYRTINLNEETDIDVLDIEFSDVKDNPEIHTK